MCVQGKLGEREGELQRHRKIFLDEKYFIGLAMKTICCHKATLINDHATHHPVPEGGATVKPADRRRQDFEEGTVSPLRVN